MVLDNRNHGLVIFIKEDGLSFTRVDLGAPDIEILGVTLRHHPMTVYTDLCLLMATPNCTSPYDSLYRSVSPNGNSKLYTTL